ncbi:MurR/RpiR family transcriptional regulator [Brevibacillus borstelensis]|uniref:MurR/RpiR family transcriptional regulator n=1 Tax=Brevibacillus borstelensis TaxID=45462 RepID=UPI0030BCB7E2
MPNVYQHIAERMSHMSKSQHKIANYILQNQNTVPFLTVGKLAKLSGVSEATVVRFATFLGYSGYPELQQYMQDSVQQQLTAAERLKMSQEIYDEEELGIYEVFQDDIANIKATMEKLDVTAFREAVRLLLQAQRVYVAGSRSAASLAVFLQYYLNMMLGNAELVSSGDSFPERLYAVNEKDVVIGISFARYTNSTIQILSFAKDKGATTIAITDNLLSPLIPHADVSLTASSQMPTFIDSFVAPLSLINSLITYVGKQKAQEFADRLEMLEEVWNRFDIFAKK